MFGRKAAKPRDRPAPRGGGGGRGGQDMAAMLGFGGMDPGMPAFINLFELIENV